MRKTRLAVTTVLVAMTASFTALAGAWKSDANGWWYDEGNGSYPKSTWSWIDGNNDGVSECYYFDPNGYCLINTVTPDSYYVNPSGAWVVNGVVQTKTADTTVSQGSGSVDVVTGKITIGESKKNKKNSDVNDEDEYDEEDEDDTEEVTEEKKETSGSKKSSKKTKYNKFVDGLDMFDLDIEASTRFEKIKEKLSLRGMDWTLAKMFRTTRYQMDSYADYYIGGNYKKLTIKATPKTAGNEYVFDEDAIVVVTVSDVETDKVLYTKTVTGDTKLFNIEADVTDVDYVRIHCEVENYAGYGTIIMKDAILTK